MVTGATGTMRTGTPVRVLAGLLLALGLVQAGAAPPPGGGGRPPPGGWGGPPGPGYRPPPPAAWAGGWAGGYWGPRYGWYGAYPGYWGPRVGVYVGAPAYYWGAWPYSLGWGWGYSWPYATAPLVVTAPSTPAVIVQQQPAAPVAETPASYWYYCTQPAGYFPYVQNCETSWMKVVPQVPGQSNSPPRLAP